MTVEELEAKMDEARDRRDMAISELKLYGAQLNEALARQRAQEQVSQMSDTEKRAVIEALSVPSRSSVGEPGA